jgi:hypothetical protein
VKKSRNLGLLKLTCPKAGRMIVPPSSLAHTVSPFSMFFGVIPGGWFAGIGIQDRGMAQPGSASALGAEGQRFESSCPDHFTDIKNDE